MFHGEFDSSLDNKGRVILPARLRECVTEDLGQGFYCTISPDGCIELCMPSVWDRRVAALRTAPFAPAKARRFQRTMSSQTERNSMDKQGRLHLSPKLLQRAAIQKQVVIVGNFDVIEIWGAERWQEENAEALTEYKNDAEQLFGNPAGGGAPITGGGAPPAGPTQSAS